MQPGMSERGFPVLITVLAGTFANQAAAFEVLRTAAERLGIEVKLEETDVIREAGEVRLAHYFRPAIVARFPWVEMVMFSELAHRGGRRGGRHGHPALSIAPDGLSRLPAGGRSAAPAWPVRGAAGTSAVSAPWANTITDVPGLSVGQALDPVLKSGVSVVVGDAPMAAGVHVMGGAPGTRETDLLAPGATVQAVDALVLSGGSGYGLAAADGVMAGLRADGRGFPAGGHRIPIVPAAILFDLNAGGAPDWTENPYPALGRAAYEARGTEVALGSAGAGTGATVAGLKGGLGSASARLPSGAIVGALVAVNALGQVTVGDGPQFWAAPFEEGAEFGGLGAASGPAPAARTKRDSPANTTIAIVATDLNLDKAGCRRMAVAAHDGFARAIVPAHTPLDGDLVFGCATARRAAGEDDLMWLGHVAATCVARAIARGVYLASAAAGDPWPTWGARFGAA